MADWLDPATWESIAKTAATSVATLTKLRAAIARRKKAPRKLDEELDALRKEFDQLVEAMLAQTTSHGKFLDALLHLLKVLHEGNVAGRANQYATLVTTVASSTKQLQDLALAHEGRLKAVERLLKVAGTRKQRRKRKPPPRVARRK